jgi:OTU domain-containing protein 6
LNNLSLEEKKHQPKAVEEQQQQQKPKKINKAKARIEKRNAENARILEEAMKEAESQVDMSLVETEAITKLIVPMNLRIKQVSADGHW